MRLPEWRRRVSAQAGGELNRNHGIHPSLHASIQITNKVSKQRLQYTSSATEHVRHGSRQQSLTS